MADDNAPVATDTASLKTRLADLTKQAGEKYFDKDYNAASDLYAQATELQAELNGEMANENAELLYLYGRSLYKVGINNSDVLGGKVAGEASAEESSSKETGKQTSKAAITKEGSTSDTTELRRRQGAPILQFAGDEAWDDGDEEEDDAGGAAAGDEEAPENAEPEQDDLSAAWEILDLARLLFERTLQEPKDGNDNGKGKAVGDSPQTKHIKERLADTHDLLAEISMEQGNWLAAVHDCRACLALKKELYSIDTNVIGEAHYKLSLALEFASIKRDENDDDEDQEMGSDRKGQQEIEYDKTMRDEAAQQMEAAILSTRARLAKEEQILVAAVEREDDEENPVGDDSLITRESVKEVKEILMEMEQRLVELHKPPVSVEEATESESFADGTHPLSGLLGSLLNASPDERKAKIEEVMKGANDLTGLVKRNKSSTAPSKQNEQGEDEKGGENGAINGNGKRRAETSDGDRVEHASGSSKKARVEDEVLD
ncbi:MAG: hypothetical protein M1823_004926 [Watsoniomyces obsoletus]|nr:MAG: hypothetical protein M1823_004926 [Watsoniomyces obsoletus]